MAIDIPKMIVQSSQVILKPTTNTFRRITNNQRAYL